MPGVAVGLGSAARSTVVQIQGNLIKSGIPGRRNILLSPLYYGDLDLSRPCWAQNLLESKFACTGFFRPGNSMLLSPPLLMLSQH